jgi:hypothetical protein
MLLTDINLYPEIKVVETIMIKKQNSIMNICQIKSNMGKAKKTILKKSPFFNH